MAWYECLAWHTLRLFPSLPCPKCWLFTHHDITLHEVSKSASCLKIINSNETKPQKLSCKPNLRNTSYTCYILMSYPKQLSMSNICAVIRWIINFLIFCIPIYYACKMPNIKQNVTAGILCKVRENSTSNIVTFGIYISTKRFPKCFTLFISRTVN